jgi:hypothetical protein
MNQVKFETREQWLQAGVAVLNAKVFRPVELDAPKDAKVCCSWPGGGSRQKAIGECWPRGLSKAKVNEMFISPKIDSPVEALATLAHEMVHAIDDCKNGHKAPFARMAKAIGLEGKMKSTVAGEELGEKLRVIAEELGVYPHQALNLSGRKKQSTRLLKCECPQCGYVARVAKKWLDVGAPVCPECEIQMQAE